MEVIFNKDIVPTPNIFYNLFCVFLTEHNKYITNVKLYWRTVVHSLALAQHGYVFAYAQTIDFAKFEDPRIRDLKTYGPRYLTGWNIAFQIIFLLLALRHDIAEWCGAAHTSSMRKVRFWRDTVFNALVVPYTLFVASMFWGLFSLDRALVFPTVYDAVVPGWFNHCVHSSVLLLVAAETVLQQRTRPRRQRLHYALFWFFSVSYAVVYYTTYYQIGRWLYPVFGAMSWWQVCLFQLGIWGSIHLFYELQWPVVQFIHPGQGKHGLEVLGGKITDEKCAERNIMETEEKIIESFKENMRELCLKDCVGTCVCV